MPIRLLENAEDLEPPDDMLHGLPELSEVAVAGSLVVGERVMLAGLLRRPSKGMLVLNALITSVSEEFGVWVDEGLRRP